MGHYPILIHFEGRPFKSCVQSLWELQDSLTISCTPHVIIRRDLRPIPVFLQVSNAESTDSPNHCSYYSFLKTANNVHSLEIPILPHTQRVPDYHTVMFHLMCGHLNMIRANNQCIDGPINTVFSHPLPHIAPGSSTEFDFYHHVLKCSIDGIVSARVVTY